MKKENKTSGPICPKLRLMESGNLAGKYCCDVCGKIIPADKVHETQCGQSGYSICGLYKGTVQITFL